MTCISAVGVNNDLTSCQSGITVRSTDDETSGRVDKEFRVLVDELLRQNRLEDIFLNVLVNLLLCHILIMLC